MAPPPPADTPGPSQRAPRVTSPPIILAQGPTRRPRGCVQHPLSSRSIDLSVRSTRSHVAVPRHPWIRLSSNLLRAQPAGPEKNLRKALKASRRCFGLQLLHACLYDRNGHVPPFLLLFRHLDTHRCSLFLIVCGPCVNHRRRL